MIQTEFGILSILRLGNYRGVSSWFYGIQSLRTNHNYIHEIHFNGIRCLPSRSVPGDIHFLCHCRNIRNSGRLPERPLRFQSCNQHWGDSPRHSHLYRILDKQHLAILSHLRYSDFFLFFVHTHYFFLFFVFTLFFV